MIRFRFQLRPLADVVPWPGGRLHWFALTDGWYWIEVGGHKLFHYPADMDGPGTPVDYYVVRLWEDLQAVLPAVLEPVPADLADRMSSDLDAWHTTGVEDAEAALDWFWGHILYTSYPVDAPNIVLWRSVGDLDMITVDWRHRAGAGRGCTVPPQGRASVSTESFLRAVEEFDRDLIEAMGHRIAEIEAHGVGPDIQLDVDQLRQEHQERSISLANALKQNRSTDWPVVRDGVMRLFRPA